MSAASNLEAASNAVIEDIARDVKGFLGGKDLESHPQAKALRQRLERKFEVARDLAAEKAKIASRKAKDAAQTANAYAHDEPWKIAAGAAAVGLLVGLLLSRR